MWPQPEGEGREGGREERGREDGGRFQCNYLFVDVATVGGREGGGREEAQTRSEREGWREGDVIHAT